MINMMEQAQTQLREMLMQALGQLVSDGKVSAEPIPAFRIEIPADKSYGDFASNIAMASAKALHMAPKKIAELLTEVLYFEGTYFERAEIAYPAL